MFYLQMKTFVVVVGNIKENACRKNTQTVNDWLLKKIILMGMVKFQIHDIFLDECTYTCREMYGECKIKYITETVHGIKLLPHATS